MFPRPSVIAAGLITLALVSACGDRPAIERVSLDLPDPATLSPAISPSMGASPLVSPSRLATTFTSPPATAVPPSHLTNVPPPSPPAAIPSLPSTGPPRFVVTARVPIARFHGRSKTAAAFIPVLPAVHDATTGKRIAGIRLPQGVDSSWQLVASAPDNRTFLLSGWTGPDTPIRFFRVRLSEDGRPGEPELVPGFDSDGQNPGSALALSPDATKLAYAGILLGGGARVSVVDLATGTRRDWDTRASTMVSGLAWAPDGERLAFAAGGWGLGVLDPADPGSDLLAATRLVKHGHGLQSPHAVAYTPDGTALIYSVGHAIERIPLPGGTAPQVLATLTLPSDASATIRFSLDGTGRYLLTAHGWRLYRVDLENGSTTSMPIEADEGLPPNAAW
ncbi:WD40 repeat domain-containing protein [Nonomuraea sp. NPDC059194]|uniref:WD40 repeat domain-containing protein n=1 Tax=Nonomuraea sp. NPDC059194 TaxID=3346764 RepID=UPI00367CDFF9